MDKKERFKRLAEDVDKCHVCENMMVYPHCDLNEILINSEHGLDTDLPYVNLWNLWHGDLNADIMVIGQDFGVLEDVELLKEIWRKCTYTNPTDKNLRKLFKSSFDIDIDNSNIPLFFTNIANCYRLKATTGKAHLGWFPICANKFMGRLIEIVEPKIIIALGKVTFDGLFCIEEARIECSNLHLGIKDDKLSKLMEHNYSLVLHSGKNIPVFPVYHPGANSQRNRSFEQQIQDWKKIAEYYYLKK